MPVNPEDRLLSDDELVKLFTDPEIIPDRSALAFMTDENVDQWCIEPIRKLDLFVTTVYEQRLSGEKSDYLVLAHARKMACSLIARDAAFEQLHNRLLDLGLSHAGIIYVSFKRTPEDVVAFVQSVNDRAIEKDAPSLLRCLYWKV